MDTDHRTPFFRHKKLERKCVWCFNQFSREGALILPKSLEETIDIQRERGLDKQYRDQNYSYFPTDEGWNSFLNFIDYLHCSEPFRSRTTNNELFSEVNKAFARILSSGMLPESIYELLGELDDSFVEDLFNRKERIVSKLHGISTETDYIIRIGNCWIGRFEQLSINNKPGKGAEILEEALSETFPSPTTVIVGEIQSGTEEFAKEASAHSVDLSLALLQVLVNFSHERSFQSLKKIVKVERPEQGISKHLDLILYGNTNSLTEISWSTRFLSSPFKIDQKILDLWNNDLGLSALNYVVSQPQDTDLYKRFENSLLFFRQATLQTSSELQLAVLWISVESFFTATSETVTKANVEALATLTSRTIRKEYWPSGAKSDLELRSVLTKHYANRSRIAHHGRRGLVTQTEVQQLSTLVCNLIITVAWALYRGAGTHEELQSSAAFLGPSHGRPY